MLCAAVGGTAGVIDFVGGEDDLLAEGAGAFDLDVQGGSRGAGAFKVITKFVLPDAPYLPMTIFEVGDSVILGEALDGYADVGVAGPGRRARWLIFPVDLPGRPAAKVWRTTGAVTASNVSQMGKRRARLAGNGLEAART